MYKLTVEFKTNQELADFVVKIGGVTPDMNVKHIMPVVTEPANVEVPKEKKPAKKKETIVHKEETIEVPPVIETPKAAPVVVDRDAIIAKSTAIIQGLQKTMQGAGIAAALAQIYVDTDCPAGTKISQLSDEELSRFFPAFSAYAAEKSGAKKVETQTQSFV